MSEKLLLEGLAEKLPNSFQAIHGKNYSWATARSREHNIHTAKLSFLLLFSWIAQSILKTQLHFFSSFPDFPKQADQSHLRVPHSIRLITVRTLTTRDCCFSIYICPSQ